MIPIVTVFVEPNGVADSNRPIPDLKGVELPQGGHRQVQAFHQANQRPDPSTI